MAPLARTKLAYRAEVVGSLLRPDYLKQAFDEFDQDRITHDELTAAHARAALCPATW